MLIDLHTHTLPLSDDSLLTADELVEEAKRRGLDGVCLTEHDFTWDPAKVQELRERHNFLILPGMEVNTEAGHMLVFGLDRYVYGIHRVEELARIVAEVGGVIIAAHPYRRFLLFHMRDGAQYEEALGRALKSPAFRYVHALEVINGNGGQRENAFAHDLRARLGLPGTAGSDAHAKGEVGRCATLFERPIRSLQDLIRELKAGRFRPVQLTPQV